MMKKLTAIALSLGLITGVANAQPFGSIPDGFEISGDLDYTFAFNGTGNGSIGVGEVSIGYRHDLNADMAVGVGLRGIGIFGEFGDDLDIGFYAYVDYRNFRLSYGAVDNAAARFDWSFSELENEYFIIIPYAEFPIGLHPKFRFLDDIIRFDATFGNVETSVSYSDTAGFLTLAGQTHFGNTRVLAVVESPDLSSGALVSIGANHMAGAFEFGGVVTFEVGGEDFELLARLSATYHINDRLSAKVVYMPQLGLLPFDLYEVSATYAFNDMFSLGISAGNQLGFGTVFGLNASAHF